MEAATVSTPVSRGAPRRLRRCADERLVARIRSGDERCFEVAYDRYHRQLLAFCRHMLGSWEEAEDALQQVFVSAHRQLLADDRPIQLKPWLYAIARNRCLSTLRDRRATVGLDSVSEPSTDGLAVAAEVERRQDLKEILGDLATLPDDERAALVLAELGDLSHEEIAVALGVRKDRVKALIFQARKSLLGSREAREADCDVIQEQLATLRGSALRRSSLRRHLDVCTACAAFEGEVGRQRAALGLVLPVVPTLALKNGILASVLASGSGAAAGSVGIAGLGGAAGAGTAVSAGAGTMLGTGAAGMAAKVLAVVAVGGGALGAGVAVERADRNAPAPAERRDLRPAPAGSPAPAAPSNLSRPTPGAAAPRRPADATKSAAARRTRRAAAAAAKRKAAGRSSSSAKSGAAKPRDPKRSVGPATPKTGQRGAGASAQGTGSRRDATPGSKGSSDAAPRSNGSSVQRPGAVQEPAPKTVSPRRRSDDIGAGALKGTTRTRKPTRKATGSIAGG